MCLLFALLAPGPAAARSVLDLDVRHQPVPLADWGDYWIDPQGRASAERIDGEMDPAWKPTTPEIYPLKQGEALWVRITVPPAPDHERWYLEVPYASVDRVTLYTQDNSGHWSSQEAGDTLAVSHWPVPHRHPLLPVAVSSEEPRRLLLRIENAIGFGAPLQFVSESYLSRHEQRVSLILGIYFGLAGLAIAIAALSAASLRDGAYALYAPFVLLMALTQACVTGLAGLHLWPHWPWWNDISATLLPTLAMAAMLLFISSVVSMNQRSRYLTWTLGLFALFTGLSAVALMVVEPGHRLRIFMPVVLLCESTAVATLVWAWRRGDRFASRLILGLLPVILASLLPLARAAGLIPVSFITTYGMPIGIAFELPVLLMVLMLRNQQLHEHQRRMRKLDRLDPETGLLNEKAFLDRLERHTVLARRLNQQGVVLLLEAANAAQLRRDFGRKSIAELPLRLTGRLLSSVRPIDSVARLSLHRFAVLVEGPLTATEGAAVAQGLVARCLMPYHYKPEGWVIRLKVVYGLMPWGRASAESVLAQLADFLSSVPRDDPRAVHALPLLMEPPLASSSVAPQGERPPARYSDSLSGATDSAL